MKNFYHCKDYNPEFDLIIMSVCKHCKWQKDQSPSYYAKLNKTDIQKLGKKGAATNAG